MDTPLISHRALILVGFCLVMLTSCDIGGQSNDLHQVYLPCEIPNDVIGSFVRVDGGGFVQSANAIYAEEGPQKKVFVSAFLIQITEVTNQEFSAFVSETGYITEAELSTSSKPKGSAKFVETKTPWLTSSWWQLDDNATWRTPEGLGSNVENRARHPVVHVTLNDARAYAKWAGGRLPTEVEWEYAASRGLFDPSNPESGMRSPDGKPLANTWNGAFPMDNTEEDGFAGTAPVGCYKRSLIGAYDMIGNVWEWTESQFGESKPKFTIKGGSFLCSSNYCRRYRASARQSLEHDFSMAHVGFRIVKDITRGEI